MEIWLAPTPGSDLDIVFEARLPMCTMTDNCSTKISETSLRMGLTDLKATQFLMS